MKLFRLRFILLGLLLYLCHAWCLPCGTEFNDPASSAYLADIVVTGTLSQKLLQAQDKNIYNATISIKNKRNILKGETLMSQLLKGKVSGLLTVGEFGGVDPEKCLSELDKNTEYVFFLKKEGIDYLKNSAIPFSGKNEKDFKKGKKEIQKTVCKKDPCTHTIQFNNAASMRNIVLQPGQKLELKCTLKKNPFPVVYTWHKDGLPVKNKGLAIKHSKSGSRLIIEKTTSSDSGKYECIVRNVAATANKSAVVTIISDIKQKFKDKLTIICQSTSKTAASVFTWQHNGVVIANGRKEGLSIVSKSDESHLNKENFLLTDEGVYTCIEKTDKKEVKTRYNVTVVDAPMKKVPCGIEDKDYCLNNGTCERWVDLDKIFCVCNTEYRNERCGELSFDTARDKLTQDKNLIIIGIISGILIFIGICVASYFLAKRRREQYSRSRQRQTNGTNREDIPPLIGYDDVDGFKPPPTTISIHKEVQTTETCFLHPDGGNLYINPLESYTGKSSHNNMQRSRRAAVSLEVEPRDNVKCEQRNSKNMKKYNLDVKSVTGQNDLAVEEFVVGGDIIENMNNLSPKHNQDLHENDKPLDAIIKNVNISSPTPPLAFDLDTESDEDVPCDGAPLTPLHISEDEGKFEFKICSQKQLTVKNTVNQEDLANSKSRETNLNLPVSSPDHNDIKAKEDIESPSSKSYASSKSNTDSSSTTTEGCDSPNTAWLNTLEALDAPPVPPRISASPVPPRVLASPVLPWISASPVLPQILNEKSFSDPSLKCHSSIFNFAPNKLNRPVNDQYSQVRNTRDNTDMRSATDAKSPRESQHFRPNRSNHDSTPSREQSEMRQPKTNNDRLQQPNDISNATTYIKDSNIMKHMRGVNGTPPTRDNSEMRHPKVGTEVKQSVDPSQMKSDRRITDEKNNRMKNMNIETCTIAI